MKYLSKSEAAAIFKLTFKLGLLYWPDQFSQRVYVVCNGSYYNAFSLHSV